MKFYEYFILFGFALVISLVMVLLVNEVVRALIKRKVKNEYDVYMEIFNHNQKEEYKEIFNNEEQKRDKDIK